MRMHYLRNLCLIGLTSSLILGCSLFNSDPDQPNTEMTTQQISLGRYYDFDDIQLPNDLKLNKGHSSIFKVDGFKAGVLFFTGRLDMDSLAKYFMTSMSKDNWVLNGYIRYPKIALFFSKPNRSCVIQIIDGYVQTSVEVWVSPCGQSTDLRN